MRDCVSPLKSHQNTWKSTQPTNWHAFFHQATPKTLGDLISTYPSHPLCCSQASGVTFCKVAVARPTEALDQLLLSGTFFVVMDGEMTRFFAGKNVVSEKIHVWVRRFRTKLWMLPSKRVPCCLRLVFGVFLHMQWVCPSPPQKCEAYHHTILRLQTIASSRLNRYTPERATWDPW